VKIAIQILSEFESKLSEINDPKEQLKTIIDFAIIYNDCYGDRITPYLERIAEKTKVIGYEVGPIICYFIQLYFQGLAKEKKQSHTAFPRSYHLEIWRK
jgi:hypothetical protein